MPTRFWCISRSVYPQSLRLRGVTLTQRFQDLHPFKLSYSVGGCSPAPKYLAVKTNRDLRQKKHASDQTCHSLNVPPNPPKGNGTVSNVPSPRFPKPRRSPRLRWAYEHEMLIKKSLKNFQYCTVASDGEMSVKWERLSTIEQDNDQLNVFSKNAKRQRPKSAWPNRWAHHRN